MSGPTRMPATLGEWVADGARRLAEAGIPEPRREARLILAHALGIEPTAISGYPERPVEDPAPYRALIERRAAREPLAYLTGRREFWSLDFEVAAATLDPRPDSETVVEAALAAMPARDAPASILDFGTGTGCLLLALLAERPIATGLGVDLSEAAIAVARRNAARHGLGERARFVVGYWGDALSGYFDLIVANPPYVPSGAIGDLQREIAGYEPRLALDGGIDGLAAHRELATDIARLLAPDGVAVLEFGVGQGAEVEGILAASGLAVGEFSTDLAGHRRCVTGRKR